MTDTPLRVTLAAELARARAVTDAIFARLRPEALLVRPVAERHRLVFYLGHLDAFDWNLLARDIGGRSSSVADWPELFAFGIDPVGDGLPTDGPEDWPNAADIRRWILDLRREVDDVTARAPLAGWLEDGWAARMAIEHRLMHAETLEYLIRGLDPALLVDATPPEPCGASATVAHWRDVPTGVATLGRRREDAPHRGWDNEYDAHDVEVDAFRVWSRPVTCGEFARFIAEGGYSEPAFWDPTSWASLRAGGHTAPAHWRPSAAAPLGWELRASAGWTPLPAAWPVWVSHAEAVAWCRWRGARLMTEAEWHRAGGDDAATASGSVRERGRAPDPSPVGTRAAGRFGVEALCADGWEWTSTPFAPFAGFEPLPFYRGYSLNFFDGKHYVMKGASPATDPSLIRPSFRNWFQPRYRQVFAKFRPVEA